MPKLIFVKISTKLCHCIDVNSMLVEAIKIVSKSISTKERLQ